MTDAELMTTDATVPGLDVRQLTPTQWAVHVNRALVGLIGQYVFKTGYFAQTEDAESPDFPTRNEAVKWILDQHKAKGEK